MTEVKDKLRTPIQNNSLHLYCEMVAEALNSAGYSIPEVLKHLQTFSRRVIMGEWNIKFVQGVIVSLREIRSIVISNGILSFSVLKNVLVLIEKRTILFPNPQEKS